MTNRGKNILRVLCAFFFLILSVGLLFAGLVKSHKVFESEDALMYHKVRDWRLVIDATFSGVNIKNGKIITNYDRSQKIGKRACPT